MSKKHPGDWGEGKRDGGQKDKMGEFSAFLTVLGYTVCRSVRGHFFFEKQLLFLKAFGSRTSYKAGPPHASLTRPRCSKRAASREEMALRCRRSLSSRFFVGNRRAFCVRAPRSDRGPPSRWCTARQAFHRSLITHPTIRQRGWQRSDVCSVR